MNGCDESTEKGKMDFGPGSGCKYGVREGLEKTEVVEPRLNG